jgi:hypothetical protein
MMSLVAEQTILRAFSDAERDLAAEGLARKVATMGSRKFEEGDWAEVYAEAKVIPNRGWSNLDIDVVHEGLGVEQKMLCTGLRPPSSYCGSRPMHPAATRSIRVPGHDVDAEAAKDDVLQQYADLIRARSRQVASTSPAGTADLRTGWLLWQRDLSEFVYFEERLDPPDASEFFARWEKREARGRRKETVNLWIFERATDIKRYSVTGSGAGAKIQPYFDVPEEDHEFLYRFQVQGAPAEDGIVSTWISETTYLALEVCLGEVAPEALDEALSLAAGDMASAGPRRPGARQIFIRETNYASLKADFPELTDDERLQQLVRTLSDNS